MESWDSLCTNDACSLENNFETIDIYAVILQFNFLLLLLEWVTF